MLGQNFQAALRSITHPVQQNFLSSYFPSRPAEFPRLDWLRPGSAGNKCFICHDVSHFINQCNVLSQYITNGKLARGPNNMITLGTGEHLPPNPHNCPWMVLADEYYARNPHLLPDPPQLGQHDPPPHAQANFATNLVQVGHPKVAREEIRLTRSSLYAATITEVTNEDDLVGLGNLTDDLELDGADALEPAYIDRLVGVLQTRAKDMRHSKKQDVRKQTQPSMNWPDENRPAQPSLPVPEVVIPSKSIPSGKPLPSTPVLPAPFPPAVPQFRYLAPVESAMDTVAVITHVLSEKVHLTVEALLALVPEVRKYFKETTTTKRLLALPTAKAHTVSTYSLGGNGCWTGPPQGGAYSAPQDPQCHTRQSSLDNQYSGQQLSSGYHPLRCLGKARGSLETRAGHIYGIRKWPSKCDYGYTSPDPVHHWGN